MGRYEVSPTEPSLAAEGFGLFRDAYLRARFANPLLPALDADHEARLQRRVERAFAYGGIAARRGGSLRGFMIAGPPFAFRGLVAALVPEFGHAVASGEGADLVGALYAASAERLVREGVHLHLIGHFAADLGTTSALFELGFGAVVREQLRDLSDVALGDDARVAHRAQLEHVEHVRHEDSWRDVAPLAAAHAAFYRESPVFVRKDAALDEALVELDAHRVDGDQLFVYREGGEMLAYLIVGRCAGGSEGRLLEGTSTAQVRSAFTVPAARRRGIGAALLQQAIAWVRARGFERLFVEHETANLCGGAFWRRHFAPYLFFSLRYVDRTL